MEPENGSKNRPARRLDRRVNKPFVAIRSEGHGTGDVEDILDRLAALLKRAGLTVACALKAARRRERNRT